jgi:hypothetical protein
MDRPVMFNGRLNREEMDTWLQLLRETSDYGYNDYNLAKAFLLLPESISFVSSLENKIIGGTSIYRDRTRLAMVLASVAIDRNYRNDAAYQIIKSSLPFFRTVAIREVDALVPLDENETTFGFPLSLVLDSWVVDIIKRIGFVHVANIKYCSFEIKEEVEEKSINWTKENDMDKVRELIWNQCKPMGLTNSLIWLAHDFAIDRESLMTVTIKGQTVAAAGFWNLPDALYVSPFVTNPDSLDWSLVAESLIAEALGKGLKNIRLPLIGEGQQGLITALEEKSSYSSCRKLSLLRKPL